MKDSFARPITLTFASQFDGLLVLKLPPRSIRGPETELVAVQLDFNVRTIEHSPRARTSRVVAASVLRS